jgi:hypothetical protein
VSCKHNINPNDSIAPEPAQSPHLQDLAYACRTTQTQATQNISIFPATATHDNLPTALTCKTWPTHAKTAQTHATHNFNPWNDTGHSDSIALKSADSPHLQYLAQHSCGCRVLHLPHHIRHLVLQQCAAGAECLPQHCHSLLPALVAQRKQRTVALQAT